MAPPRSPPSTSAPSTASTETCEAKGRRPEGQAEDRGGEMIKMPDMPEGGVFFVFFCVLRMLVN